MDDEEYVAVHGTLLDATNIAIRIKFDGQGPPIWLPRSQLRYDSKLGEDYIGQVVFVEATSWIAEKKGLI